MEFAPCKTKDIELNIQQAAGLSQQRWTKKKKVTVFNVGDQVLVRALNTKDLDAEKGIVYFGFPLGRKMNLQVQ